MTEQALTSAKRVFITGAVSLLGRAVVRHLKQAGHAVIGTVTTQPEAANLRADGGIPAYPGLTRAGEIRSAMTALGKDNLVAINLITQLANHAPFFPVKWDTYIDLLNESTPALIEAAKTAGITYLVHGSYAFADLHTEDEQLTPLLSAIQRAEALVLGSGIPSLVLRFGYTYGDAANLRGLIASVKAGRPVFTSAASAHAAWIEADDGANAVVAAINGQVSGHTLDIVSDRAASPAEFLSHFTTQQGVSAPSVSVITAPLGRLSLGATQYALLNASAHADNAAAKTALGWTPRFATIQNGLDDLLLTWRASNLEKA